jgi:transposase InsO family protein
MFTREQPNRLWVTDIAEHRTYVHSDHGVQFTSWAFTDHAKRFGLVPSMGSIGDDNGVVESFWGRMRGAHRGGCTPAHDPAAEGIDDERDVDKPDGAQ